MTEAELPSIFKRFGNFRRFCYGFASLAQREFYIFNYAAAYFVAAALCGAWTGALRPARTDA